jgi:Na+/melibiose symporter-like transporter
MGQNVMYFVPYLFLSTYLLMCGLSPAVTAVALVVVKIWDATNDCIFGGMVDKIHFKNGGKFLPWLRMSVIPIGITTVGMFCIPSGFSVSGKLTWFVVFYVLWDMSYTLCDTPAFALVTTMTNNQDERTSLMTTSRIYANVGMIIAVALGDILTSEAVGMSFTSAALFGVIFAMICMSVICFKGKEHVRMESVEGRDESYTMREMFSYLGRNKYLLIYYLGAFFQLGLNTMPIVVMFACFYYFHSALLATVFTTLNYVPAVAAGFIMPVLLKRFSKYKVFMFANIVYAAASVLIWLAGPNFAMHLALSIVRGAAYGVDSVMMFMFTPDCAEYGQYKTGIDARGITFAVQTFTEKLNSAVASALGVGVLGIFGWISVSAGNFAELAAMNVMQSSSAMQGLWISYTLIPAIGAVLAVVAWSRYRLPNSDVELMAKYNGGEISREECDASLSRKY